MENSIQNTPIIGRIYHVVDKTTGEVVKVGSTIQGLRKRFGDRDYKKKYVNHFLREAKTILSTELDWYEKGNAYCPFLWHLVAAEHLEMLHMNTYRKGRFSNQLSPLDQKFFGFDGVEYGRIGNLLLPREARVRGGQTRGKQNVDSGWMSELGKSMPHDRRIKNSSVGGKKRAESFSSEYQSKAGRISGLVAGRKLAESGHFIKIAGMGGHVRWHLNRNTISKNCNFCKANLNVHIDTID